MALATRSWPVVALLLLGLVTSCASTRVRMRQADHVRAVEVATTSPDEELVVVHRPAAWEWGVGMLSGAGGVGLLGSIVSGLAGSMSPCLLCSNQEAQKKRMRAEESFATGMTVTWAIAGSLAIGGVAALIYAGFEDDEGYLIEPNTAPETIVRLVVVPMSDRLAIGGEF